MAMNVYVGRSAYSLTIAPGGDGQPEIITLTGPRGATYAAVPRDDAPGLYRFQSVTPSARELTNSAIGKPVLLRRDAEGGYRITYQWTASLIRHDAVIRTFTVEAPSFSAARDLADEVANAGRGLLARVR